MSHLLRLSFLVTGPLPTTRKLQLSPHLSLKSLHSLALTAKSVKMEQEMSEVKKTDHSADVLASIKSQVPTAVDKYLGIKLDDALLKILERHTADLIGKYSVLYWPESVKNQIEKRVRQENYQSQKGTRFYLFFLLILLPPSAFCLSAASGSAKPPPKADDQSSKKPRESEASASKQHPALTPTEIRRSMTQRCWGADSSMHRFDPESRTF
ncbi:hypothetical protein Tco_0911005 [Tanacetum coccineum]|uniref:Uncharacterized protein n=1 Tax=Tanacetum coccineum TaxID=301880 RepID=A0ABQ5CVL6_9ASTR